MADQAKEKGIAPKRGSNLADLRQSSRPLPPIRTLLEDKEDGEDYSKVKEVLKQHIKSHKRDSVSAIKNISSTLASLANSSNATAATTRKTSYSPRFNPFSSTIDLDSPLRPPRKEPYLGLAVNSASSNLDPPIDTRSKEGFKDTITSSIVKELSKKAYTIPDDRISNFLENPDISNTYSDSDQAVLLILLHNSLSSSPRAAISRPIESKKEDIYNKFHALTFSTYRKGLSAFNAEFNGYLAKLTIAKIDIDPSLILNQYFKALESKFPSWVLRQKSSIRQARMLGLIVSSLNIEYLMADILEESRNPAIEAYRAAHIAHSSYSTPNSNSNPSKKGKNKKKGKKKASYNIEGQNYSAKSAEQASFMLGSYNLAIEEEEESDSSSNSSSSSDSDTQLAQLLALKGYKKRKDFKEKGLKTSSNKAKYKDNQPRRRPRDPALYNSWLYNTGSTDHTSNSKEQEPKPLTGTGDLPHMLREPVIEGNKVEKAISSPTLKEPNIEGDTVKIRPRPYNRNPIVLLLLNHKIRYRWVFNLPNKSGSIVANAIKGFFRGLRNGFGRYPTKFHFNGGTKITDLLTTWLAKRGIKFSTSAPYIYKQNSLVERSVGVILDPITNKETTPFQALFNKLEPGIPHIPNLERYRAIGARGEAIIPLEKRSKSLRFTSRTEECKLQVVLGSKTYLVYIPSRRAVLKTSTVKFIKDNTVLSQPTNNTALEGELVDLDLDLEGAVSPDPSNLNTEKPISIEIGPSKLEPYESSSDSELDEPLPYKPINPPIFFAPKPIEVIAPDQPRTNKPLNNSDLILEGDKMQLDYYKLLAKTSSYILSFVYKARKSVISKDSTPTPYKQVLKLPRDERSKWLDTITKEFIQLLELRVFKFLPRSLLPSNRKLITYRNVLKVKKDAKNRPIKYKSHIPPTWHILLAIESKKKDIYNEFHALTFSTYKKGLLAFNAEFNGFLTKLTIAKIDIDPSLILNLSELRGTEITDLLTTWLAKRGIKFSTCAPYIYKQNGLVERSVRVILDPITNKETTPFQALFNKLEPGIPHIPNLERYRAIGARGEAIIPLEKRSKSLKFTSRMEECKLQAVLGSKTYLVYIPSRRAVLKTSTVKFIKDNTVLSQPTNNTALEGELVDLDLDLEGAVSPDPSNLNTKKHISIEIGPSKLEPYESSSDSELDEPLPDKPINPVIVESTRPTISIRKPELPEAFPLTIEPIFAPKPIEVIAPDQPITNEPLDNSNLILEGDEMQLDYYKLLAKTSSYILSFVYKA
ncbi:hypothetical protein P8C59_006416 [Phyllachora maydis]|uniref:Integrase catalytic domain-containing protein n=1 Tax=Phyllachora maydis TaxID=1825666 RepID=A0AAD9I7J2_9PEZI|nr:hypothetical protein P8C59_006416 [Phyllachora maydis]